MRRNFVSSFVHRTTAARHNTSHPQWGSTHGTAYEASLDYNDNTMMMNTSYQLHTMAMMADYRGETSLE